MVFESKRKQTLVEAAPVAKSIPPHAALALREEVDPDPVIEEMVVRLREGLGSLQAFDEWGRPMSWRNVVRLAVGPTVAKLRDAQTASGIAVALLPVPARQPQAPLEEPAEVRAEGLLGWPAQAHPEWEPLPEPLAPVSEELPAPIAEVVAPVAPAIEELPEPVAEPVAELVPEPVAEVVAEVAPEPAAEPAPEVVAEPAAATSATEPVRSDAPAEAPAVQAAPAAQRPADARYAGSLFRVPGDQRAVPVSTFTPGQVLRQSGSYDSTTAKYDRFLTSLYGVRKADPQD